MKFDLNIITDYWLLYVQGFGVTLGICTISLLIALVLGTGLALLKLSSQPWVQWPAVFWVEWFRNIPFLIQIFLIFYALPGFGIRLEAIPAGIIGLSLFGGAQFTDVIRGAILSVPQTQIEAARSFGMPWDIVMRRITFPQMIEYVIPPLINEMTIFIKESAMLSIITVPDLTMAAQRVNGLTFSPVETFTLVTILYWSINEVMTRIFQSLEQKMLIQRGRKPLPMVLFLER